mmetsp:Transcript_52173/g.156590  ORF Transcript_52173/g.156590 Transcript_52173/m.156590 type:complete len:244 (+) Transcript_52173:2841-3572(+)
MSSTHRSLSNSSALDRFLVYPTARLSRYLTSVVGPPPLFFASSSIVRHRAATARASGSTLSTTAPVEGSICLREGRRRRSGGPFTEYVSERTKSMLCWMVSWTRASSQMAGERDALVTWVVRGGRRCSASSCRRQFAYAKSYREHLIPGCCIQHANSAGSCWYGATDIIASGISSHCLLFTSGTNRSALSMAFFRNSMAESTSPSPPSGLSAVPSPGSMPAPSSVADNSSAALARVSLAARPT